MMKDSLPFLVNQEATECNKHKLYKWQKEFFECTSRMSFITAANQIGKSSINIIKELNLGYRTELWPRYFGRATPSLFVYMYPDSKTARTEFYEKWETTYLPQGEYKDDPYWGWEVIKDGKDIEAIRLASGVTIYWRYYSQQPRNLQAISADYVGLDEECPQEHWDELVVRTSSRAGLGSGLLSMVFTATLGQEYLYDCMERQGTPEEVFPQAWKRQISLFDCLKYADGSPSDIFTRKRIMEEIIPSYSTENEIQKRVYGRFIKDSGLIYQEFDSIHNVEEADWKMVKGWIRYVGMDFGSGGKHGHPSSIAIVAVNPTYDEARVVYVWGSGKERMTQGDLLKKYVEITQTIDQKIGYYDWAATDLGELAIREAIPLIKAEKSHEKGNGLLNSLFRTRQLKIFTGEGTGMPGLLTKELRSLTEAVKKNKRKDDHADALRYAMSSCPIRITKANKIIVPKKKEIINPRMAFYKGLDMTEEHRNLWSSQVDNDLDEAIELFEENHGF